MKRMISCDLVFAILILTGVVFVYTTLGFVNAHTPALECVDGRIDIPHIDSKMSLLSGQWLCYPGAPTIDKLCDSEEYPVDIMRIGIMEGNTFRVQLSGPALDSLCFMLPRSRGSQVYIDGQEVLPQSGKAISSQDVFAFADVMNASQEQHDFVLRIPVSNYFYSGYQGVVLGDREQLTRIDQIRYFIEVLCLGLYITLGLVCMVLFLQKTSETYILYLVFFTLLTAYRFMNFSEHFSSYAFFQDGLQFYRFFFFLRYILCRAFVFQKSEKKRYGLDVGVAGMVICELAVYFLLPDHFASFSTNLNLISLALEGVLIVKGLTLHRQGMRILLAGWGLFAGMELFYRLLHVGIVPQGMVDVMIRPTQYGHVAYLIAFAAAVFGKFAHKFSEAEDMTVSLEQKVLEQTQELREKNQRIVEEQNQRQQFMIDIVHNLRNPLFALGGYMELLEEQMPSPTDGQEKYLRLIDEKLSYVNRMVDDMLLVNRLGNGKISFHFIRLALDSFLNDVVSGNKLIEQCEQVTVSCPALYLDADGFRLHQAIDNLLDNAILHGDCTQIHISAQQQDDQIKLLIQDNGKGMTEEQLERAFDRYYTSGKKNSTGLGLSIVAAIIREHHGKIHLHSSPGNGVTATIILPVDDETVEQD